MPLGQSQDVSELIPEAGSASGFDIVYQKLGGAAGTGGATGSGGSGEAHMVAKGLYRLGKSGSDAGLVSSTMMAPRSLVNVPSFGMW